MPRQSMLIPDMVAPKSRKYACKLYEHFDDIAVSRYGTKSAATSYAVYRGISPPRRQRSVSTALPLEYLTPFSEQVITRALSPKPARKQVLFERCRQPVVQGMSIQQFKQITQDFIDEEQKQSRLEHYISEFKRINGHELKNLEFYFDKESVKPMWYKRQFAGYK